MQPFDLVFAKNEQEALESNARFLGGGTTLLDLMKLHVETPERLADVNQLPLKKIEERDGAIFIGALATNTDVAHHELVTKHLPALSQAILAGASPQLRNMATVGGNLLQRTRCSYFRDLAFACNKREPGAGCAAYKGVNRMHAILGGSTSCIATHASDMCVPLAAMEAKVHVRGPKGARVIAFADFHRRPGTTPQIETSLQPGELITGLEIQRSQTFVRGAYVKIRDRASYAFALTSAAAMLDIHDNRIQDARISLGGVGTVPWRAAEAEAALRGKNPTTEVYVQAAKAALADAKPLEHNKFKVALAQKTLVRALETLGGRA